MYKHIVIGLLFFYNATLLPMKIDSKKSSIDHTMRDNLLCRYYHFTENRLHKWYPDEEHREELYNRMEIECVEKSIKPLVSARNELFAALGLSVPTVIGLLGYLSRNACANLCNDHCFIATVGLLETLYVMPLFIKDLGETIDELREKQEQLQNLKTKNVPHDY